MQISDTTELTFGQFFRMGREIITLQLGHHANFVATHYWNTQAAYLDGGRTDASVLFRHGEDHQGRETWTPRLVLADLKGSFGALNPSELIQEPYSDQENNPWDGNMETQVHDPFHKNDYLLSLDSHSKKSYSTVLKQKVKVWSDFNSLYLHPSSFLEISTHTHNDPTNTFTTYTRGKSVYNELKMDLELMDDRVRKFMEEADCAQGFQVFADVHDAFGGFASMALAALTDEYPKKSCFVYGIHSPPSLSTPESRKIKRLNSALFMHDLLSLGPLYIPLHAPTSTSRSPAFTNITTDFETPYEWSAYIAAGIETMTMPFRYMHLTQTQYRFLDLT